MKQEDQRSCFCSKHSQELLAQEIKKKGGLCTANCCVILWCWRRITTHQWLVCFQLRIACNYRLLLVQAEPSMSTHRIVVNIHHLWLYSLLIFNFTPLALYLSSWPSKEQADPCIKFCFAVVDEIKVNLFVCMLNAPISFLFYTTYVSK